MSDLQNVLDKFSNPTPAVIERYRSSLRAAIKFKEQKRSQRWKKSGHPDLDTMSPIVWSVVSSWAGEWLLRIGVGKSLFNSEFITHKTQRILMEVALELRDVDDDDLRSEMARLLIEKSEKKLRDRNLAVFQKPQAFTKKQLATIYVMVTGIRVKGVNEPPREFDVFFDSFIGEFNEKGLGNLFLVYQTRGVTETARYIWNSRKAVEEEEMKEKDKEFRAKQYDYQSNQKVIDIADVYRVLEQINDEDYMRSRHARLIASIENLESMVGMEEVKNNIAQTIISFIQNGNIDSFQNMVLQGPPGTGKTMFAGAIAAVMAALGITLTNTFTIVSRQNLIGGYEGWTATTANDLLLNTAFEGTIFIDEAPSIARNKKDESGVEALQAMLRFMTEYEGESIILIAGYSKALSDSFFSIDEGLERRFPKRLSFTGYTPMEMVEISIFLFHSMTEFSADRPRITKGFLETLAGYLVTNVMPYPEDEKLIVQKFHGFGLFGNFGGDLKIFMKTALDIQSNRLFSDPSASNTMIASDTIAAIQELRKKKMRAWLSSKGDFPRNYKLEKIDPDMMLGKRLVRNLKVEDVNKHEETRNFNQPWWMQTNNYEGGGTDRIEPEDGDEDIVELTEPKSRTPRRPVPLVLSDEEEEEEEEKEEEDDDDESSDPNYSESESSETRERRRPVPKKIPKPSNDLLITKIDTRNIKPPGEKRKGRK